MTSENPPSPVLGDTTVKLSAAEKAWEAGYARLLKFRQEQGHANVPAQWPADPALVRWVKEQRHNHEYGLLYFGQSERLRALGWEPDRLPEITASTRNTPVLNDGRWEQQLAELIAFQHEHGHMRVPKEGTENKSLCKWMSRQRSNLRLGCLSLVRVEQLDAIGFDWNPLTASASPCADGSPARLVWDLRFAELVAFQQEHGHMRVPRVGAQNKRLRKWVGSQRHYQRQGILKSAHHDRLDAIGFEWNPLTTSARPSADGSPVRLVWDVRFAELVAFQQEHGHMYIPRLSAEHKRLYKWVGHQRYYQRQGILKAEHRDRLEAIGFEWNPSTRRPA